VFDTLVYILLILIWPLCLFIIGLVLLQGGAGDMSSAFGGGGQLDSTLGVGAGRKMSKLTGWMVFFFLAIVTILAIPHGGIAKRAAESAAGHSAKEAVMSPAVDKTPSATSPSATPTPEPPAPAVPPVNAPPTSEAPASQQPVVPIIDVQATVPSSEPATQPAPANQDRPATPAGEAAPAHAPSQLRAE
jgi:protein translocase SecG subunit